MTIDATKDDMGGFMHRFNSAMALNASDTLGVGRCLGLIDPVPGWKRGWFG
jgi:hypothetical protein